MRVHQLASLGQRWRIPLLGLSAGLIGLAFGWLVVRQPKVGLLLAASLLPVLALAVAVKAKPLVYWFYLFALGWGPILQGVMGLATFRIDEVVLPIMAIIYVLLPAMSNFIRANGCGLICEDNAQSMADVLQHLLENPGMVRELSERAVQTISNGNTWEDRARYVAMLLTNPRRLAPKDWDDVDRLSICSN